MWESVKFWWGEQGGEAILALFSLKSGSALCPRKTCLKTRSLKSNCCLFCSSLGGNLVVISKFCCNGKSFLARRFQPQEPRTQSARVTGNTCVGLS